MDKEFADLMRGNLAADAQAGAALTRMADRNLSQGLGVIHNLVIQSQSGVQDDPATLMAFQAAARSPRQGALSGDG